MNYRIFNFQFSIFNYIVFVLLALLFTACKINYSAVGVDIPPDAKTMTIKQFQNNAPTVILQLSNELTTQLRDKFRSSTKLSLVDSRGDLYLEGEITGYSISSVAVGADRATMNRLTITVRIHFENKFDEKKNKDQSFSRYQDYDATQTPQQVQDNLINQICSVLVDDIFMATVGDW
jgi:biopolymer transport protein ExbD